MTQNSESASEDVFANHPRTRDLVLRAMQGEDVSQSVPEAFRGQFEELLQQERGGLVSEVAEKHPSDMDEDELRSFIDKTIPFQYKGLPPEALEIVWSADDVPYFADDQNGERRQIEVQKRALALTALDTWLPEAQKRSIHQRLREVGRREAISTVRAELGIETPAVVSKSIEKQLSSESLDQLTTHYFESAERGVSVLHTNKEHGQDAFSVDIEHGVFCVSDGASSYGKSGPVSAEFSRALVAEAATGKSFAEIFNEQSVSKIAERVKTSSVFKDFNVDENPHAKGMNKEAGLATVLLTRINKDARAIEWVSVGDSPLMVVDKNPDGTYSFEIVNDNVHGVKISDKNFTNPEIAAALGTPETHLVGIGKDGTPRLNDLKHMQSGLIEYRPGRTVILASDFLTKMMALSPQMIEARRYLAIQSGKEHLVKAFEAIQANTQSFDNPLSGSTFKPELLFDGTLSAEQLKKALDQWKDIPAHNAGRDDMTAVCIKMDNLFA